MSYRIITGEDERVGSWVCERTGGHYVEGSTVGLEQNGALVAGILYDHFNGASIQMHVASEGKHWLNREYLWFAFHYPFEQLKVRKVIGVVPSVNEAALRFDRHLGFTDEGCIKDAHPQGDLVLLTMTKDQCRHLEGHHGF